jgi:hypothetical protein
MCPINHWYCQQLSHSMCRDSHSVSHCQPATPSVRHDSHSVSHCQPVTHSLLHDSFSESLSANNSFSTPWLLFSESLSVSHSFIAPWLILWVTVNEPLIQCAMIPILRLIHCQSPTHSMSWLPFPESLSASHSFHVMTPIPVLSHFWVISILSAGPWFSPWLMPLICVIFRQKCFRVPKYWDICLPLYCDGLITHPRGLAVCL